MALSKILPASQEQYAGARNLIINGGFQCWQRGTSVGDGSTVLNDEFLADRWRCDDGVGGNMIISQQSFTTGQTDVPNNPKFYHRLDFPTTAPSDNGIVEQRIEGVSTAAGETVTLSFWAKGTMSSSISINIVQYFGTGGSPSATVDTSITTFSLTSSWVKHTVNINVPSISGKTIGSDTNDYLSVKFLTGTNTGQFDLAQVQLEVGETATPFEHRSYGDELARCQRYGWRIAEGLQKRVATGVWNNSTSADIIWPLPVQMRAAPTLTVASNGALLDFAVSWHNVTSVTLSGETTNRLVSLICGVASSAAAQGDGAVWGGASGINPDAFLDAEL